MNKKRTAGLITAILVFMTIFSHIDVNYAFAGTDEAESYNVTNPHIIINQIYGGSTDGYVSHSFIELYNPTDAEVDMDGWSINYRSSEKGRVTEWKQSVLSGSIKAHSSYLIRCGAVSDATNVKFSIASYDHEWDQVLYNKGLSIVLMSVSNNIGDSVPFDINTGKPLINGYVDMLAAGGSGNNSDQHPAYYEKTFGSIQTKKMGIRRKNFQDTDDNGADAEAVDYSEGGRESYRPRSGSDREWDTESQSGNSISPNETNTASQDKISTNGLGVLSINTVGGKDPSFTIVYPPAGCGGRGISDNSYVSCSINFYLPDGTLDFQDTGKIKIRGNTSASGAIGKFPYKLKMNNKQSFSNGVKAKKWILLSAGVDLSYLFANYASVYCGVEWQPSFQYVEVYLNGDYKGCYVLTEAVENIESRLGMDENGFLIENDAYWWNSDLYFKVDNQIRPFGFTFKYPDSDDIISNTEYVEGIRSYMNGIISNILNCDASLPEQIDMRSFAAWYLVNDYLCNYDTYGSNMYWYRVSENGKLKLGPTWDYDSNYDGSAYDWSGIHKAAHNYGNALFNNADFKRVYRRLFEEKQGICEDLESYVNNYLNIHGEALKRCWDKDALRWNYVAKNITNERDRIFSWYRLRRTWIDNASKDWTRGQITDMPVKAQDLTYIGRPQELLSSVGTADTGTVQTRLDNGEWTDNGVPVGTEAGEYTVYYRAKADAGHDTGVEKSLTVTISCASVTVKGEDTGKTYGDADPGSFAATVTGLVNNEQENLITYSVSRDSGENAGTYAIRPGGDKTQGNYSVTYENGIFTINKKAITPSIEVSGSYKYNGNAVIPTFKVKDGETELAATDYIAFFSDNVDAGTGSITIKAAPGGNYSFIDAVKTFTIEKSDDEGVSDNNTGTVSDNMAQGEVSDNKTDTVSDNEQPENYNKTDTVSDNDAAEEESDNKEDTGVSVNETPEEKPDKVTDTVPDNNEVPEEEPGKITDTGSDNDAPEEKPDKVTETISENNEDPGAGPDKKEDTVFENNPAKVPLTEAGASYASLEDNFAAIAPGASDGIGGNIKKLELDFSNVAASGVNPAGLKMTAINGSRFTTRAKVKDRKSVKTTGKVKAKYNKKDGTATITCKASGTATLNMEDGNSYTIAFTVEKPKPQKTAKRIAKGSGTVTKTIRDLFGTTIDSGKLEIIKEKKAGKATLSGNMLMVKPEESDVIKLQYKYLNKRYKMTIKI